MADDSPAHRKEFLDQLAKEDFLVSEESTNIINRCTGTKFPASMVDYSTDADELITFVRDYWILSPVMRTIRWNELSERLRKPAHRITMHRLKAGLNVPVVVHEDPIAEEIVSLIRELYLLPPRQRAIRRAEWLEAQSHRFREFVRSSGITLKKDMPAASLEPRLFHWFDADLNSGDGTDTSNPTAFRSIPITIEKDAENTITGYSFSDLITPDTGRYTVYTSGSDQNDNIRRPRHKKAYSWQFRLIERIALWIEWSACILIPLVVILTFASFLSWAFFSRHKAPTFTPEEMESFRRYESDPTIPKPPKYSIYNLLHGKTKPIDKTTRSRGIVIPTSRMR